MTRNLSRQDKAAKPASDTTTPHPRRQWMALLVGAMLASGPTLAGAQGAWPAKPVRILVGAPAGGTADLLARVLGEALSKNIGQSVVVENKPGGLGAIVMDAFLAAPRDGYTYVLSVNSLVTEIPYTIKPKYDPHKDIKPLVKLSGGGLVLVSSSALPPKNFADMIAYVKAHPGKISFASYTPGTSSHIRGLQLNKQAGLDMQHVGYKGSPPALQDVMGGQVQFMFDGLATSTPLIKSGKLRPYAVTASKRAAVLPDVPTMIELGYPDMTQMSWMGLWTTPDVPAAVQQRMRTEVLKVLHQPAIKEKLAATGLEVPDEATTPEDMMVSNLKDYELAGQILRAVNYKPE